MGEIELDMQDSDDLDDTERTTEELVEIMSTGGVIAVELGDTVTLGIGVDGVGVNVHIFLADERVIADVAASTMDHVHLTLPTMEEAVGPFSHVEPGQMALMLRAFEARARLLGQ